MYLVCFRKSARISRQILQVLRDLLTWFHNASKKEAVFVRPVKFNGFY